MRIRPQPAICLSALLLAAPAIAADFHLRKQFQLGAGGELLVRSEAGSVEVRGVEGETATVTIDSDRDDFSEKFDVRLDDSRPGRLEVVVERKGSGSFGWNWGWSGRTTIVATVPRRTAVEARSAGGGVDVESITGAVTAKSSGGGVTVIDVDGDVIAGSSGGGVDVTDVRGSARVDSSGGSVEIRRVAGDVDAGSSGGGVRIDEAGGYVVASSSGGGVRVAFAPGNAKGGDIGSSGGGVTVRVDAAVGLEIDASSSGGGVTCDLPVTVRGKLSRTSVRGTLNGGGERLKVRSSGGGVTIEAR